MSFLDLILIAFLLYMFFSGYSKGFFSTLYDLVSFMIMMLFIYFNVETISSIIQIYKPVDDPLSQLGGSVINMLIVFIIVFVVLEIIRRLIGVLIKPLVNQLTDHFALTAFGCLLKGQHTLQLEDKDILKKMIIANNHAYDHGILDEHDATQFVYTQLAPALMNQQVIISHEEKLQFISLLNKTPYTETEKNTILNNIGSE